MTKTTESKPVIKKENYSFDYKFSAEELTQKSKQLAQACQERERIDDDRKSAASGFKAKLDSKNAEINLLSNHIETGQEYITRTCEVHYDFDAGVKYYHSDSEIVGKEKMVKGDYQTEATFES